MELTIFNTLTREKEIFTPIDAKEVTIYSCGPTVYGRQHLGNLRAAFVVDLLKNTVRHIAGYPVKHVMNITDVGHLTGDNEGDANTGEDRMEKGARTEGTTAWEVAAKFTNIYMEDLAMLRIDPFEVMPKATEHIPEQIALIKELEEKGYTYVIPGEGVYMDTSKVDNYGALVGHKHLEGLEQGARIEDTGKKNATDFALWKFNVTGKKRDMEWESPRGVGFPGWHIECSAMSMKYLGDHIDIHTGGVEHIPIHHTNEIAQSECSHGNHPWVNYWVHYQHLMMNGKKFAKSTGNVAFMNEVAERGYAGEDVRYFFLQAQYRSFQDFSWEALEAAKTARVNLKKKFQPYTGVAASDAYREDISYLEEVLMDDMDTPKLLARLWAGLDALDNELASGIRWLDENVLKLGLFVEDVAIAIPSSIVDMAQQRWEAKQAKDYAKADELRAQLATKGWEMREGKDTYEIVPLK